jgi:energy-coupling factor transporter ATP-binding protein EcfA2
MDIFHKLHREQGKTIVLITHSKELAAETERIITISDGRIISDRDNKANSNSAGTAVFAGGTEPAGTEAFVGGAEHEL